MYLRMWCMYIHMYVYDVDVFARGLCGVPRRLVPPLPLSHPSNSDFFPSRWKFCGQSSTCTTLFSILSSAKMGKKSFRVSQAPYQWLYSSLRNESS